MPIAYWCILIAGVMPAATVAIAKWGRRDFDNSEPRRWLEQQTGLRRRADAAHRNHFEAFPFFAAAVLTAQQIGAAQNTINMLAATFIALRVVYTLLYLADKPTLRSISWALGYAVVIALFVVAAVNAG
jgi:uncharacterized MAPEG superfamily protein